MTTDHSLVAELVRSGVLTPEEAERHPQRSAITRAVGTERAIDADVFTMLAEPGDLFLLCSDGLTDMLSKSEIAADDRRLPSATPKPRRERWSPQRTLEAARTTSPSCCSSSSRASPSRSRSAERGAGTRNGRHDSRE